jgi:hypothetical protein
MLHTMKWMKPQNLTHTCGHDQIKNTTYVILNWKGWNHKFCFTRVMIQDKTHLYFILKMDENITFTSHQSWAKKTYMAEKPCSGVWREVREEEL